MNDKDLSDRLAILIDADNAQPSIIEGLLAEVAKLGVSSVKRIYGDWTTPNLGGWKKVLLEHSIQPIQQFRYTVGKNATDSAMVIDAMDLLYKKQFDGFCIVSSDSDFTRLASRIREEGLTVYGVGERKTPSAFVSACDRFIYTDVLLFKDEPGTSASGKSADELGRDQKLVGLLRSAIDAASDDDGWAHLGGVGSNVAKQAPDFDPRNWGYKKLSDLLDAMSQFEVKREKGPPPAILVRARRPKAGR